MPSRPTLDPQSVDRLWRELHARIQARVGSASAADDVVQETFLSALRHPPPDPTRIGAWLHVVARRIVTRGRRRERSRQALEREAALTRSPGGPADCEPAVREALHALACLDEPYRRVLQLRYVDGLDVDEIARALGRPAGTVRSQAKRGLDRLRRRLGTGDRRRYLPGATVLGRAVRRWRARWKTLSASSRSLALAGASGACALVLLTLRETSSARERETLAAGAEDGGAPMLPAFDWRTSENRERVELDTWLPPESTPVESRSVWPLDVHGLVLGQDDRPVNGAAIHLGHAGGAGDLVIAHSDASGRFRLTGAEGRSWIWAETDRHLPSVAHLVGSIPADLELELGLGPPRDAVLGRLWNAAGTPVPHAEVTHLGGRQGRVEVGPQGTLERSIRPERTRTDENGLFRIGGLPGSRVRLHVLALGEPPVNREFEVPPTGTALDVVLPASATLTGHLSDAGGAPLANRELRLVLPGLMPEQRVRTDADGAFRMSRLPPGPYEIRLADEPGGDRSSLYAAGRMREGETRTCELRCSSAHTLAGRAAAGDEPLADRIVELERLKTDWFPDTRRTRTDASGHFAFGSCAPDTDYRVRLLDPAGSCVVASPRVRSGAVEILLDPRHELEELARFHGCLEPRDPAHVAVFVELWSEALGRRWLTPVDPSTHRFAFADLPPVSYRVRIWVSGVGPVTLGYPTLVPGQVTALRQPVVDPTDWRLRVVLPDDLERERVAFSLTVDSVYGAEASTQRRLALGPDDSLSASLVPGSYECTVLIDGKMVERREISVGRESASEVLTVPSVVPVVLEFRSPRLVGERERLVVTVEGEATHRLHMTGSIASADGSFRVWLPPRTRRLWVETPLGLTGEWESTGVLVAEELVSIALSETP